MAEYLSKFGPEHCDLPTILWNVAVLLRMDSINIDRHKRIPWIVYLFNIITCGIYFYVFVFSMTWFSFVRCPQIGDYTAAAVGIALSSCSCTCLTKFIYMKLYSDTVTNLVEDYLQCNSLVVPHTRHASNILKYLKIVKKRATIIWTALIFIGIIYILIPFTLPGRHLTEDLVVIYGLEPMFESPNYEIAQTITIIAICFAVCTLSNITVFIVVIVGYIESQMLALSEELLNVWEDSRTFYEKFETNSNNIDEDDEYKIRNIFIRNRLQYVIKFHIMCMKLRDHVEKEMRIIFIVEFVFMTFGTVAELLGGLENMYMQLPYSVIQIYTECLVGQRLIDASNIFEESVYDCKWENFNISNRKTILYMLHCSQKTLTLSAGGITILSFAFLMRVTKTAYSAYTALQSTLN